MKERFLTGTMIVFVVAIMFLTKIIMNVTWIFDIFVGLIVILSALEFSRILKKMGFFNHEWIIGIFPALYYVVVIVGIQTKLSLFWFILIFLALFLILIIVSVLTSIIRNGQTINEMRVRGVRTSIFKFSLQKALNTLIGFIYPSLLLMFLIIFNHIEEMGYVFSKATDENGLLSVVILAVAFLIPFIADTFAYLTGTLIGGKKLCPKISPIKTISGAIGGVVWTAIILVVLFLIFNSGTALSTVFSSINLTWWHILIIAIIGSIACVLGDLFESYTKRKADIKDSSDILPGHGGILDRLDSFCFSTPLVFIFFVIFLI